MTVKELINKLNMYCEINPYNADRTINIMVKPRNGQRIGINNGVEIDDIITGFDWLSKYMFIIPKNNVIEGDVIVGKCSECGGIMRPIGRNVYQCDDCYHSTANI